MPWSQMSELNSSKNTVTEPPANGETVAWRALLAEAIERLTQAGIPHAPGEARWILETVSGMAMTDLMRDFDSPVSVRQVSWFDAIGPAGQHANRCNMCWDRGRFAIWISSWISGF